MSASVATVSVVVAAPSANATSAGAVPEMTSPSSVTLTATVSAVPVAVRVRVNSAAVPSVTGLAPGAIVTSGVSDAASSSPIVTVASVTVPASTPGGSVPKVSTTLSPSSSNMSWVAVSVKVCAVEVAPKVTVSGTPDQSSPVSPCAVAPPAATAATGTVTSRPGAPESDTVTSTVAPSSTV